MWLFINTCPTEVERSYILQFFLLFWNMRGLETNKKNMQYFDVKVNTIQICVLTAVSF